MSGPHITQPIECFPAVLVTRGHRHAVIQPDEVDRLRAAVDASPTRVIQVDQLVLDADDLDKVATTARSIR